MLKTGGILSYMTRHATAANLLLVVMCSIPDDHIAPRRSAFFMACSVLRDIREGV